MFCESYSIRTVKDWNALPQSVMSASSLALFKSRMSSHDAPQSYTPSVWCPSSGALQTNDPDPDINKLIQCAPT